jgi:hypothetical protein
MPVVLIDGSAEDTLSSRKLVARGLALLERLRTLGCKVTMCPDCGGIAVAPPPAIQQLLEEVFEEPAAVQAALAVRPNEPVAWENDTPGDHDVPYAYGQLGDGRAPGVLSPDELQHLRQLQPSRCQLPADDQAERGA